jgi:hypothetical protein
MDDLKSEYRKGVKREGRPVRKDEPLKKNDVRINSLGVAYWNGRYWVFEG